MMLVLYLKKR